MTLAFNAAPDRVLRTTDLLDKNNAYAWGGYYKFTDTAGVQTLFSLNDDGGSNYDFWGVINGVLYIETQGGFGSGIATLAPDTWYFISGTRTTPLLGTLIYYINGVLDASFGDDTTGRAAASRMEIGGFTSGNSNRFKGLLSYHRAWAKTKGAPGFLAEMGFAEAQDTVSLYANWPTLSANRFADDSGNGRDWTEVGSVDYSADFPFGGGSTVIPVIMAHLKQQGIA